MVALEAFLSQYVSEARGSLEKALKRLFLELEGLSLYPQAVYALSGGKRLRSLLTLLAGEAVGGSREALIPLALSVELIHTATLIHDDIIDGDEERRGKPTLHVEWGSKALLAGDLLFTKAISLATLYPKEVVRVLSEAAMETCDGEFLDVTMGFENSSEEGVLAKVRLKSAALFRAASQCGAMAGGGSPQKVEALKRYGENFGIAYQLSDDLEEAAEGFHKDLKAGRLTLPYLHLYQHGGSRLRSLLLKAFRGASLSREEVKVLSESLQAYGSLDYCRRRIASYVARAVESLEPLGETRYRRLLEAFAYNYTGCSNETLQVRRNPWKA